MILLYSRGGVKNIYHCEFEIELRADERAFIIQPFVRRLRELLSRAFMLKRRNTVRKVSLLFRESTAVCRG